MMGFLRRALQFGWKLALVAAVAGFVVYQLRFAPVPVESHITASGPIVAEVMGTGTLEPRVQVTLGPKISGRITQLLADQGDRVKKGQLLVTLDDGDLRQQVEMARAELAATKASVDRAAAEIGRAEASAVFARAEIVRVQRMQRTSVASESELDQATERKAIADAEVKRAQLAKVEVERQVIKAEESLRYYEERLADAKIASPFDGLVTRRSREPGDIVVPGSSILQVVCTDQMWVSAWVDESAMASLAVGQPARVIFRSEPEKTYAGTVTRMAPLADRETREFMVDVTVKELPRNWAVGQRAEVYIETSRKDDALLAPQRAILWQKGRPGLFVAEGGHAKWRSIDLGLRGSESVEVIKGLAAGEKIIWLRDPKASPLTEGRAVSVP